MANADKAAAHQKKMADAKKLMQRVRNGHWPSILRVYAEFHPDNREATLAEADAWEARRAAAVAAGCDLTDVPMCEEWREIEIFERQAAKKNAPEITSNDPKEHQP